MKKGLFAASIFYFAGTIAAFAAPSPQTFDSPDKAAEALFAAASSEDEQGLNRLFGPSFIKEISSGDAQADKYHLQRLTQMMTENRHVVKLDNGANLLLVGLSEWPFPAPLVERDGRWAFNSVLGAEEVINRRIGENELRAIKVGRFYADAQRLYRSKDRNGNGVQEYAQKFVSSPGKFDGLYWPGTEKGASPFGPLVGRAIEEGYELPGASQAQKGDPTYQGYRYRILTKQGKNAVGGAKSYVNRSGQMTEGFGLLAYPARWGVGGVMSFIVGPNGDVYQKDLGKSTAQTAAKIKAFDPDGSWDPVEQHG